MICDRLHFRPSKSEIPRLERMFGFSRPIGFDHWTIEWTFALVHRRIKEETRKSGRLHLKKASIIERPFHHRRWRSACHHLAPFIRSSSNSRKRCYSRSHTKPSRTYSYLLYRNEDMDLITIQYLYMQDFP